MADTGTVTLVTGASSGIGRHLALRLARAGDPVVIVARREHELQSLAREIESHGGRALAVRCDVTQRCEVLESIATAERILGPIERLVANAGGGEPSFPDRITTEHVREHLELNLLGAVQFVEVLLPAWIERGRGHLVVNSSLASVRGLPSAAAYGASKAALSNFAESLRVDLRGSGVDVTVIELGPVRLKAKSKKNRIFSVSVDDAAARMQRAIIAREAHCAFPRRVAAVAWLVRALPASLYDALVAGRGRKPKPGEQSSAS